MERCPTCAAIVPAGAQWCSLCFADLRPKRQVAAAVAPAADSGPQADGLDKVSPTPGEALGEGLSSPGEARDDGYPVAGEARVERGRHARSGGAHAPDGDRRGGDRRVGDRRSGGDRRKSDRRAAWRENADPLALLDFDLSDETLFEMLRQDQEDQLGTWSRRMADPRFKWGLAIGGSVGLIAVLVAVAALFGTFV